MLLQAKQGHVVEAPLVIHTSVCRPQRYQQFAEYTKLVAGDAKITSAITVEQVKDANTQTKADEEAKPQAEANAAQTQSSYTPTYTNNNYSGFSGYTSGGNSGSDWAASCEIELGHGSCESDWW